MTHRLITQNVRGRPLMTKAAVKGCVDNACDRGDLVLWQEVDGTRYEDALKSRHDFGHFFGPHGGPHVAEPISYRKSVWTPTGKDGAPLLHHGYTRAGIRRRYMPWIELRHTNSDFVLRVMNAHYVAWAWSGRHPFQRVRQRLWLEGNTNMRALVHDWAVAGHAVEGGGDYNRDIRDFKPLGPEQGAHHVTYLTSAGIDVLWKMNGDRHGLRVIDEDDAIPHCKSDHVGRLAVLASYDRRER